MTRLNRFLRSMSAICAAAVFSGSSFLTHVRAEENAVVAADGNTVSQERLSDLVIEYDELGTLVHTGNPDVKEMTGDTEENRSEYAEIREYLLVEAGSTEDVAEASVYRSGVKTYNEMIKSLDSYASNRSRIIMENQLVNAAQSLMISYESITGQIEYFSKMEQLYSRLYSQMQLRQQSGMATTLEVEEVRNAWLSAQASCLSLAGSEYSISQSLYQVLAFTDVGGMTIAKIPAVDAARIENRDLEADTNTALGNNLNLSNERRTSSGGTTAAVAQKTRTLEELEQEVKIGMEELYQNLQQARISYQAAETGMSGADLSWQTTGQKYRLGMLSETDYLQAELSYLQKQNDLRSAELNLLQAVEAYDWAVKGIM